MKLTTLAAVALLLLAAPSAALAQRVGAAPAGPDRLRQPRLVQNFQRRIVRGTRAGRVDAQERAALRARMAELRKDLVKLRAHRAGESRTARLKVMRETRLMNRAIIRANRGRGR